jgi:exonuclease III
LLSQCDILFIQEHWLSDHQLNIFNSIHSDFTSCGVSGFGNDEVLNGRPYGGCAILWRKDIQANIVALNSASRRVCSVLIDNHIHKLLCFNVYLPYEDNDDSEEEFNFQLRAINNIIEQHDDAYVVVGGDFNVDFSRNWRHTNLLNNFCEELDLWPVIKHKCSSIEYTYHFNMLRVHVLDHFIISRGLFDGAIDRYFAIHDVDNTSDHAPICMHVCLNVERIQLAPRHCVPKPAWYKATDSDKALYKTLLSQNLAALDIPYTAILCRNVMCSDPSHSAAVKDLASSIATACIKAASLSIPQTNNRQESGRIPGWNDFVAPYRSKSLFWHNIWVECDRPRYGVVADIMRRTRAQYHRAIRRVKINERNIINEKFAEAVIENRARDFWSEVKRVRRTHPSVSSVVDGLSQAEDIADVFACKYQDL